jgi:hypothetical protein
MSATQAYASILTDIYSQDQIKSFEKIGSMANRGEISMNQAYKMACKEGFSNATEDSSENTESNKSFIDWVNTANSAGWIDKGFDLFQKKDSTDYSYDPINDTTEDKNHTPYIIGGVILLAGIVGTIIWIKNKK